MLLSVRTPSVKSRRHSLQRLRHYTYSTDISLNHGCISTFEGATSLAARAGGFGLPDTTTSTSISGTFYMWGLPLTVEYRADQLGLYTTGTSSASASGASTSGSLTSGASTSSAASYSSTNLGTGPQPTSPSPNQASAPSSKASSSGLSTGAKAGIAIGVVVIVLLLLVIAILGWKLRRRRDISRKAELNEAALPLGGWPPKSAELGSTPAALAELSGEMSGGRSTLEMHGYYGPREMPS